MAAVIGFTSRTSASSALDMKIHGSHGIASEFSAAMILAG
jgi:hypothetical protein